jgi:hypothetical protein
MRRRAKDNLPWLKLAGRGIDKLPRDAQSVRHFSNARFQHITHAKHATASLIATALPLNVKLEWRDHEQRFEARKCRGEGRIP